MLGCNHLSFAFRYPCDKDNNIYLQNLKQEDKEKILDLMLELIYYSTKILLKHNKLVSKSILKQANILKEKFKNLHFDD